MAGIRAMLQSAVSRALLKAPKLLVLYLVVGATGVLLLDAAFDYSLLLYAAIGGIYALFWLGAEVITLNLLTEGVDRDTSIAAMYETSYQGLGWTAVNMLIGWIVYGGTVFMMILPAVLELFTVTPFTKEPFLSVGITAGSIVLAGYIALRLLLFPVHIAVENEHALAGLQKSSRITTDHLGTMTVTLLAVLSVVAGTVYTTIVVSQTMLPQTALVNMYPYLQRTVESVVVALVVGLGTIIKLACIAAAHDVITETD